MKVEIEQVGRSSCCLVRLGKHELNFKTRVEAEAFAKQLQARVNAPHPLPARGNEVLSVRS
ncbi:hypothetical protein D3C78_1230120 [compost metagenome]